LSVVQPDELGEPTDEAEIITDDESADEQGEITEDEDEQVWRKKNSVLASVAYLGSGAFFYHWIRDSVWEKNQDPDPG
jgi:hypothetical protein